MSARRDETRRKLVRAASEEVAQRGFHAASVDVIASRAGFSIGALYSNFANKDELFLSVFDGHLSWFEQHLAAVAAADDATRAAADWMADLGRDPDQFLIFIEFWAYAVRQPALRAQLAQKLAEMRERVASVLGDDVALLALATARGLALERLADPKAVPDTAVATLANLAAASNPPPTT